VFGELLLPSISVSKKQAARAVMGQLKAECPRLSPASGAGSNLGLFSRGHYFCRWPEVSGSENGTWMDVMRDLGAYPGMSEWESS